MCVKKRVQLLVALSQNATRVSIYRVLKSLLATSKVALSFGVECMRRITTRKVSQVKSIDFRAISKTDRLLIDTYVNIFHCDGCSKELADESWFTCVPCASSYFSSFDLCTEVINFI